MLISLLTCSLVGQTQTIRVTPNSLAYAAYQQTQVTETFHCNYGLNPAFRQRIAGGALTITGTDPEGDVRIVELTGHPFFLATLFLPQVSSEPGRPHPLIGAYLRATLT